MPWANNDKLTPTNLNNKSQLVVFNVKDAAYGATGDGSTDDTAAVQAAVDAAEAASGGIVFFPKGIYLTTGLTIDSDSVEAKGAGRGSEIRVSSDARGFNVSDCSGIAFRQLYLNNTGTATSASASGIRDASSGGGTHSVIIEDVEIEGFYHGVRGNSKSNDWHLHRVRSHDNVFTGALLEGSRINVVDCTHYDNGTLNTHHGLYINSRNTAITKDVKVVGGSFYGNSGAGITIGHGASASTIERISLTGARIADNGTSDHTSKHWALSISAEAGASGAIKDVKVTGCEISNQTGENGSLLLVQNLTSKVVVTGCTLSGSSQELVGATDHIVFVGNTLSDTQSYGIGFGSTATGSICKGNHFAEGGTHAIFSSSCDNLVIQGNSADSSWDNDGIRLSTASNCVVEGNFLDGLPIRIVTSGNSNLIVGNHTNGGGVVDGGTSTVNEHNL